MLGCVVYRGRPMAPSSRAALLHWDSSKLPLFVHDAGRIAVHRVAGSTMVFSMSQYYEKIISSGDSVIFVFLSLPLYYSTGFRSSF